MKTSNVSRSHPGAIIDGWVDGLALPSDPGTVVDPDVLNAAGRDLVAGDVVVLALDGTLVLTTTAQDTRPVGVVLGDIAWGASGPVQWQGPVGVVQVTAAVTAGNYAETSTTAGLATESATRRTGSFGYFTSSGTSPSAYLFGGSPDADTSLLRWEAVTDGEDVFVWEGDDLVHEWKAY